MEHFNETLGDWEKRQLIINKQFPVHLFMTPITSRDMRYTRVIILIQVHEIHYHEIMITQAIKNQFVNTTKSSSCCGDNSIWNSLLLLFSTTNPIDDREGCEHKRLVVFFDYFVGEVQKKIRNNSFAGIESVSDICLLLTH